MRSYIKEYIICCFLSLAGLNLYAQTLEIIIQENEFGVDAMHDIILSRIDDISQYEDLSSFLEIKIDLAGELYTFVDVPDQITYKESYTVFAAEKEYILYFTPLPIVTIAATDSIVDDPKRHAWFTYADENQVLVSDIGIEIRGGFSQTYPKKTYDLEFWEDETGEDTENVQLGDLRSDDDWVMDALYNEPLRMRSTIAHKLWLDMHVPYYLNEEDEAKSGADVMFVELFFNQVYNGLYTISEQVDRKLLKLKKRKEGEIRGELYKGNNRGATTFTSLPNFDNTRQEWAGHEIKYPDTDDVISWDKLYGFTDFVMNSDDETFLENIWALFHQENHIDYFLFLNMLSASDNTGKNIFIGNYTINEPYFYVPWDLDGCLGTQWQGNKIGTVRGLLTNTLHDRVLELNPGNYRDKASKRWFELRENILQKEALIDKITTYFTFFSENRIYERESIVYPNYDFDGTDFNYMTNWISGRIDYLDEYFDQLTTFDLLNNDGGIQVAPNPVEDFIYISGPRIVYDLPYEIYNPVGTLIDNGRTQHNQIVTTDLPKGIYTLILNGLSYKILKQ